MLALMPVACDHEHSHLRSRTGHLGQRHRPAKDTVYKWECTCCVNIPNVLGRYCGAGRGCANRKLMLMRKAANHMESGRTFINLQTPADPTTTLQPKHCTTGPKHTCYFSRFSSNAQPQNLLALLNAQAQNLLAHLTCVFLRFFRSPAPCAPAVQHLLSSVKNIYYPRPQPL